MTRSNNYFGHLRKNVAIPLHLRLALLLCFIPLNAASQQYPNSVPENGGYVKREGNPRVIVFVHGLFSGSEAWKCGGDKYWPAMLAEDHDPIVRDSDIFVVGYPTPKRGGKMTMPDLITEINDELVTNRVFSSHKEVVFIAHSMGGLVTEQLLLTYRDTAPSQQVSAIFFYGTPLEGSTLANLARFISSDPLLKELTTGDHNLLLHDVDQRWLHAGFGAINRYCAYEKLPEGHFIVVDQDSATRGCTDQIAIDTDHRDLVKPCSTGDHSYTWFVNKLIALEQTNQRSTVVPIAPPNLPVQPNGVSAATPYDQVGTILTQITEIQRRFQDQFRYIGNPYASYYKGMGQALSIPKPPDELVQRLVLCDQSASNELALLEPKIDKARSDVAACFLYTPHESKMDDTAFIKANIEALTPTSADQIVLGKPNAERFSKIIDYFQQLHQRLENSRCGMY